MIKKFIIALALVASSAQAEVYFAGRNSGGGEIILTTVKTNNCDGMLSMYATLPDGTVIYGCWLYYNDKVHVKYFSGDRRVYEPTDFVKKGHD